MGCENCAVNEKSKIGSKKIKNRNLNIFEGIVYGLIPHTGCIAFIIGSVLGVTLLTELFRPLLMNRWFFHILIIISIGFATLSSAFYLRKNGLLSYAGMKRKWQYLSTMYGSTIGVNVVLFMLVFPMLANVPVVSATGAVAGINGTVLGENSLIKLAVDIPCPGHAPLISGELKSIDGVINTKFSSPNIFDVLYDSSKTSKKSILELAVFKEYPATVLEESEVKVDIKEIVSEIT
jgi:copper chaperone CopZ